MQRINEVLALPRETDTAVRSSTAPQDPAAASAEPNRACLPVLEFRDVWFDYDGRRPVLCGVSFEVPRRGRVALIGLSGAGKSTVFALTERFYDPNRGQILFHGTDVRDLDLQEYRSRVGLVEQHVPLLYGSLRDNLTYARPDASEADIERVVELGTEGLDNDVGEHGILLSGGERQRIAIARALLGRPDLLLLAEPTAHLDPLNEAAFTQAVKQISRECALLLIAHRFSTVQAADRVVVLQKGEVAAIGTHEELLEENDYYRSLAKGMVSELAESRTALGP